jgi:hypothetical protein
MEPSTFYQELARTRHAESIREAARHAQQLSRDETVTVVEPRRRRLRLITPRLALRLVPG